MCCRRDLIRINTLLRRTKVERRTFMPGVISGSASQINFPAILIANGLGICLMLAILLGRRTRARSWDSRLFDWMCRICLGLCVLETVGFLVDRKSFFGARQIALGINTSIFMLSIVVSCVWLHYVYCRLFGNFKRLYRRTPYILIPAGVMLLLTLLNLFVPLFFGVTADNVYYRAPLFFLPYVVNFGYITFSAIQVHHYHKKVDKYLFMPVKVFLIPVYLGTLIQLLCYGLSLIWVSVAIGLTFLYMNLQQEETFLDPLTNLYNRNYLLHYIEQIAGQTRIDVSLTGIMLDVNDFKHINDTYGHAAGDTVLCAVGRILVRAASGDAAVIRYGGDEFIILVDGDMETVERVQKKVERAVREYNRSNNTQLPLSLSSGIAKFDRADIFAFFQKMDQNMYEAKRNFYLNREADNQMACESTPGRKAGKDK